MRLTFEQIKSITFGTHSITTEEDGIHFDKCTKRQIQAWRAHSETLGLRAVTTSGVRLDFYTDAKGFTFKNVSGAKFEVKVNGTLRQKITECGEHTVPLCDGWGRPMPEVRVTLVFPSHSVGVLEYVELDGGSYIRPVSFELRMLFIGDSITQGWNSDYDTNSYAWRVIDHFDADALINGIGGAFFATDTFDTPNFEPDLVVIAYGTNDYGRSITLEEKKAQISGYLELVKGAYGKARVAVVSPIWRCRMDGTDMGESFEDFCKFIENEARVRGFDVISGVDLVPPIRELYADGHLHPNDCGFAFYAESLIKRLRPIVAQL